MSNQMNQESLESKAAYAAYCRAWKVYREMSADVDWSGGREPKSKRFFSLLRDWIRSNLYPQFEVTRWPGSWLETEMLFCESREKFIEAVEWAEEQIRRAGPAKSVVVGPRK